MIFRALSFVSFAFFVSRHSVEIKAQHSLARKGRQTGPGQIATSGTQAWQSFVLFVSFVA